MAIRVITVRQLRDELASVMDELASVGEVVVTQRGQGRAVLMELERYNELVERLEYLEDTLDAIEGEREGAIPASEIA